MEGRERESEGEKEGGKGRNAHVRLCVCCLDLDGLFLVRLSVGSSAFGGRSLVARRSFDEISDDSAEKEREGEEGESELLCCCFLSFLPFPPSLPSLSLPPQTASLLSMKRYKEAADDERTVYDLLRC